MKEGSGILESRSDVSFEETTESEKLPDRL